MRYIYVAAALALLVAACDININLTAPCQVIAAQDTLSDTVVVVTVSQERCPK
jgi:hypothetical protein